MHIQSLHIHNFRRLKHVRVDLEADTTIFVGANNSGKTSVSHALQCFLSKKENFSLYDFTADCWPIFNRLGEQRHAESQAFPRLSLDIWFAVDADNLHRVKHLIPTLDWAQTPVGIRLEYAPKDDASLLANYRKAQVHAAAGAKGNAYKPWPQCMTAYLERRLRTEYEIRYLILDYTKLGNDHEFPEDYRPASFASTAEGQRVLASLVRVDFMDAQRHLSDATSQGRAENLSKKLSAFYKRNLDKYQMDLEALSTLAASEASLNAHFATVFAGPLSDIRTLGYPGFSNPEIVVKSSLKPETLVYENAGVHYVLPGLPPDGDGQRATLPDRYNGLGFKNLIYMVVEVLDFHTAWREMEDDRPPVHLVMIEEPEAHLHAQLQQVFIRKIRHILRDEPDCCTQLAISTHSAHIVYESSFRPIRYFQRRDAPSGVSDTDVKNLSVFHDQEPEASRTFLLQYFKLTHCDLFFADAAVFIEGNVERLLIPLMIEKEAPELKSCHLTLLEVGGAFAHKFQHLIEFLGLTTLIVTDLDSVLPKTTLSADETDDDDPEVATRPSHSSGQVCPATAPDAVTDNPILTSWVPGRTSVADLLAATEEEKLAKSLTHVRVAYQTSASTKWQGKTTITTGRTLEEAFALQNLPWTQEDDQAYLGLRVVRPSATPPDISEMRKRIFSRVRNMDKTRFALGLLTADTDAWVTPTYIVEGLRWLSSQLRVEALEVATGLRAGSDA
ncbi:ATP-dependent endonuclease [Actinoallomurus sp. CA-142502]|uniref:ATP-dependent endonuclease n=1 Tax=Actinoallomurus sp. CA-142502 TaxID=3239885 RepID=UPI003D934532